MLKKIMKHEFKATYRFFVPIYIALAVLTGFGCFVLPWLVKYQRNPSVMVGFGFAMMVLILGYIFIFMSPYIFLSIRFYQTTATREAYLTFTLPADTKIILLGKYLTALAWSVVTSVLWFLSLLTFMSRKDHAAHLFRNLFTIDDNFMWKMLSLLSILLGISTTLLAIFAAVSLSQLVRSHRILASIGFLAALYTIQQIVSIVILTPFMLKTIRNTMSPTRFDVEIGTHFPESTDELPIFLISLAISIAFSIGYYFLSNYMLKRKLNLL